MVELRNGVAWRAEGGEVGVVLLRYALAGAAIYDLG
jgi:hypothetical protein